MATAIYRTIFHDTGRKKPKGTNNNTFKHALIKSFIIYTKGIIFTVNSSFNDIIFGKPTKAKTAVK